MIRLRSLALFSLTITFILSGQTAATKSAKPAQPLNDMARGYLEKARETGDTSYLRQAAQVLDQSFEIEKDNYEGQRIRAGVLLARHDYARALELAKSLHQRNRDDLIVWGEIADADLALGDYADAEKSVQWMLDLRAGDPGSLERGARMRGLVGNTEGAPQLWKLAFQATGDREIEQRAFLLAEYANFYLSIGSLDQADRLMTESLQTLPGYHLALTGLAKVRIAQRRYADAVQLLRKKAHPDLPDKYLLAEALDGAGQRAEAAQAYADFEKEARAVVNSPDNANRELVFYYADRANMPSEAVRVARLESAQRQDIQTLDALAWALHVNGEDKEARKQMDKAVAVGTRDRGILAHSQAIGPRMDSGQ